MSSAARLLEAWPPLPLHLGAREDIDIDMNSVRSFVSRKTHISSFQLGTAGIIAKYTNASNVDSAAIICTDTWHKRP